MSELPSPQQDELQLSGLTPQEKLKQEVNKYIDSLSPKERLSLMGWNREDMLQQGVYECVTGVITDLVDMTAQNIGTEPGIAAQAIQKLIGLIADLKARAEGLQSGHVLNAAENFFQTFSEESYSIYGPGGQYTIRNDAPVALNQNILLPHVENDQVSEENRLHYFQTETGIHTLYAWCEQLVKEKKFTKENPDLLLIDPQGGEIIISVIDSANKLLSKEDMRAHIHAVSAQWNMKRKERNQLADEEFLDRYKTQRFNRLVREQILLDISNESAKKNNFDVDRIFPSVKGVAKQEIKRMQERLQSVGAVFQFDPSSVEERRRLERLLRNEQLHSADRRLFEHPSFDHYTLVADHCNGKFSLYHAHQAQNDSIMQALLHPNHIRENGHEAVQDWYGKIQMAYLEDPSVEPLATVSPESRTDISLSADSLREIAKNQYGLYANDALSDRGHFIQDGGLIEKPIRIESDMQIETLTQDQRRCLTDRLRERITVQMPDGRETTMHPLWGTEEFAGIREGVRENVRKALQKNLPSLQADESGPSTVSEGDREQLVDDACDRLLDAFTYLTDASALLLQLEGVYRDRDYMMTTIARDKEKDGRLIPIIAAAVRKRLFDFEQPMDLVEAARFLSHYRKDLTNALVHGGLSILATLGTTFGKTGLVSRVLERSSIADRLINIADTIARGFRNVFVSSLKYEIAMRNALLEANAKIKEKTGLDVHLENTKFGTTCGEYPLNIGTFPQGDGQARAHFGLSFSNLGGLHRATEILLEFLQDPITQKIALDSFFQLTPADVNKLSVFQARTRSMSTQWDTAGMSREDKATLEKSLVDTMYEGTERRKWTRNLARERKNDRRGGKSTYEKMLNNFLAALSDSRDMAATWAAGIAKKKPKLLVKILCSNPTVVANLFTNPIVLEAVLKYEEDIIRDGASRSLEAMKRAQTKKPDHHPAPTRSGIATRVKQFFNRQ